MQRCVRSTHVVRHATSGPHAPGGLCPLRHWWMVGAVPLTCILNTTQAERQHAADDVVDEVSREQQSHFAVLVLLHGMQLQTRKGLSYQLVNKMILLIDSSAPFFDRRTTSFLKSSSMLPVASWAKCPPVPESVVPRGACSPRMTSRAKRWPATSTNSDIERSPGAFSSLQRESRSTLNPGTEPDEAHMAR